MMHEFNCVAGSRVCHAEARVAAGGRTERHYRKVTEELYFILEGAGEVELDGERRVVGQGDAILIPSGAWHTIMATEPLRGQRAKRVSMELMGSAT